MRSTSALCNAKLRESSWRCGVKNRERNTIQLLELIRLRKKYRVYCRWKFWSCTTIYEIGSLLHVSCLHRSRSPTVRWTASLAEQNRWRQLWNSTVNGYRVPSQETNASSIYFPATFLFRTHIFPDTFILRPGHLSFPDTFLFQSPFFSGHLISILQRSPTVRLTASLAEQKNNGDSYGTVRIDGYNARIHRKTAIDWGVISPLYE